jgi:hypothetical protein
MCAASPVSARIPTATVGAIDEWARRNETTRSGAIALLVELGLSVKTRSAPSERQRAALADLASEAIDCLTVGTADSDEKASRLHLDFKTLKNAELTQR